MNRKLDINERENKRERETREKFTITRKAREIHD